MDYSRKILTDRRVSITNPRIIVLEELLASKNPLTIDELQKKLKNKVAKSTLYRVLNDLKKIQILNEFSTPDNLTGDEFEKTLSEEIKRIEKNFNFSIEDHRLELFGKCTELCQNCN